MASKTEIESMHMKGLRASETFKQSSAELIDVLQWMDRERGYLEFKRNSVYEYAVMTLKLSEDVACNLIAIARKANEVPELKESVRTGAISVTNARKIASVITNENQAEWLKFASESSSRAVQKEIARVNPKAAVIESIKYVTATRLELKLGVSEELEAKLTRARDVLSQKLQAPATLEQALEAVVNCYLHHHDPVEKAARFILKSGRKAPRDNSLVRQEMSPAEEPKVMPPDQEEQDKLSVSQRISGNTQICKTRYPAKRIADQPVGAQLGQAQQSFRKRRIIKASVRHEVNSRDDGQCTQRDLLSGKRCPNRRWVDIHHVIPIASGGGNEAENLTTLCSHHHSLKHRQIKR